MFREGKLENAGQSRYSLKKAESFANDSALNFI